MAETTTPTLPSPGLRELIATLNNEAAVLEPKVVALAVGAREVAREFSSEIDPLRLNDRRYERLAAKCGLQELLDAVDRMGTALGEVAEP